MHLFYTQSSRFPFLPSALKSYRLYYYRFETYNYRAPVSILRMMFERVSLRHVLARLYLRCSLVHPRSPGRRVFHGCLFSQRSSNLL